jgi:hypothetical protein
LVRAGVAPANGHLASVAIVLLLICYEFDLNVISWLLVRSYQLATSTGF